MNYKKRTVNTPPLSFFDRLSVFDKILGLIAFLFIFYVLFGSQNNTTVKNRDIDSDSSLDTVKSQRQEVNSNNDLDNKTRLKTCMDLNNIAADAVIVSGKGEQLSPTEVFRKYPYGATALSLAYKVCEKEGNGDNEIWNCALAKAFYELDCSINIIESYKRKKFS